MIPHHFEYLRAESWSEAVELLQTHENAKILAGGQSLVPLMKMRIAQPEYIIDVTRIKELSYIEKVPGSYVKLGALVVHRSIESSPMLEGPYALLREAASSIGDTQVRNRGTIGGSLCHADPGASYPPVMLALEAEMVAVGKKGERSIRAQDFFVDALTTSLDQTELLREIRLPNLPDGTGSAFLKFATRPQDFALAAVAAVLSLDKNGKIKKARVGLGGVQPTPTRLSHIEGALEGQDSVKEDLDTLLLAIEATLSDIHASATYRKHAAALYVQRALQIAFSRASNFGNQNRFQNY